MSSLRNAVQRRNHKERAQPQERQKWGLLEKRKDYKLRAADHKVKKRKLKALQQKADERNEDEFYFAMVSSQSQGGRKVAQRGAENSGGGGGSLNMDVVKLMKTQDAGYLRTMLQQTKREKERVEQEVVRGNVGVPLDVVQSDRRKTFQDDGVGESNPPPKPTETQFSPDEDSEDDEDTQPTNQTLAAKKRKLQGLRERERDIGLALQEVEQQQARMAGTAGGANKKGVKFKMRERKR